MKMMQDLNNKSIPKIIHYCWFGPNSMERMHKKCLESWRKNLPEFEFMKWDESNTEISQHTFLEAAYKMEKWAFVSDYVRLQKLHEFGGIYLDTDMLLLKPLDKFLSLDTFFGAENLNFISCGIIGARKRDPFIYSCLTLYDDIIFEEKINLPEISIPQLITSMFRSTYNYEGDFADTVKFSGITVLPPVYFYSLPYKERILKNKKKYVDDQSYGIHLWDESWKNYSEFHYFRKGMYLKGYRKILRSKEEDFSYMYLKKILASILKSITSG